MKNLYEYFEVSKDANIKEILKSYKQKIANYTILDSLTDKQIYEIKMLKVGLHILTNSFLRHKYNLLLEIENQKKPQEIKKSNSRTSKNEYVLPIEQPLYDVACSLRPIVTSNRRQDQGYSVFSH
jgi:hypothetical protein